MMLIVGFGAILYAATIGEYAVKCFIKPMLM